MQCQYCGSTVENGQSACPNCGGALNNPSGMQPPPPTTNPVTSSETAFTSQSQGQTITPPKKKRRVWLIVIAIVVLLAVIGSIGNCASGGPKPIAVADVVGMKPTDAESTLTRSYTGSNRWSVVFTIEGNSTTSSASQLDDQGYVVVSQSPTAGEEHSTSDTLKITLDLMVSPDYVAETGSQQDPAASPVSSDESQAVPEDQLYKTLSVEEYASYLLNGREYEEASADYWHSDVWLCAVRPGYGQDYAGFDEAKMAEYGLTWKDVADTVATSYWNGKLLSEREDEIDVRAGKIEMEIAENLWGDIQQNRGYAS